jgi:hypothetical protein
VVSTNLPRSSVLSEKPIAWTRKSIVSQRLLSVSNAVSSASIRDTSQSKQKSEPSCSASGRTRLSSASPWYENASLGPVLGELLRDSPGERLLVREAHDQPALALHQSVRR